MKYLKVVPLLFLLLQCQTIPQTFSDLHIQQDDSPELAAFLQKIEPLLYKELDKNAKSQAFKGLFSNFVFYFFLLRNKNNAKMFKSGMKMGPE